MSHDIVKAALDAPRLAEEAKARKAENANNARTSDQILEDIEASVSDLKTKAAIANKELADSLSGTWRPPGFLFSYELVQHFKITIPEKYWQRIEPNPFSLNWSMLPQKWPIPRDKELIALGHKHKCIKRHFAPIGTNSGRNPRSDIKWLYLSRSGQFWGTPNEQDDAEKKWLEEAKHVLLERHKHTEAFNEYMSAHKAFFQNLNPLRSDLYGGKVSAFFYNPQDGSNKPIKREFWSADISKTIFDFINNPKGTIAISKSFLENQPVLGAYSTRPPKNDTGIILFQLQESSVGIQDNSSRSDLNLFAGGVAYVDDDYDERLGEVLRPLPEPTNETSVSLTHTGDPGRPTKGAHLYEAEFNKRCEAGNIEETLAEQARQLLSWLTTAHPNVPRPTVRVIENRIRPLYNRTKNTPRN